MILTCDYCSSRYILPEAGLVNCPACGAPGSHDVENPRADIEWRRLAAYNTFRSGELSSDSGDDSDGMKISDSDGGYALYSTG
jgi:hypothetical protein